MIAKYPLIPILCLVFVILGCPKPPLTPFEKRIPVFVQPPVPLTADYSLVSTPFDTQIRALFSSPFVELPEKVQGMPYITTYQNPLIPTSDSSLARYILTGDVERVAYEPISEVESRIESYAFGGLILMWLTGGDDGLAAIVQYRFQLLDDHRNAIDEFVVVGVAAADALDKGRRELTKEANYAALSTLCVQLFTSIQKNSHIEIQHDSGVRMSPRAQRQRLNSRLDKIVADYLKSQ